ncbi:MAG: serine/threonine protein kinase [Deltaproteobacteria bacterium]|nr:serine/threonine protein kinase [Deltaproteobacteria bacterium]
MGESRSAVERHLAECPECRDSLGKTAGSPSRTPNTIGAVLARGTAIGRYLVLERLGAGGMGVVYAAYDPGLDRSVALKLVLEKTTATEGTAMHERLLREGQAIAQLSHPNVVAVHDTGTFEGQVFIAMELLGGGSLRSWLQPPRAWREILDMFVAVGQGLAAAHRAGIIHRDFKPENVLLGKDGRPRVTDFGLARAARPLAAPHSIAPASSPLRPVDRLTAPGEVMGTLAYMAPEQLQGLESDERTDQYAFCVALWESLYRTSPYAPAPGAPPAEWRLLEPAKDTKVPSWLRRALQRGLHVEPADRHPSMDELLAALGVDAGHKLRQRVSLVGGVAALLAAATWGTVAFQRSLQLCSGAPAEVAEQWNPERQQELHKAFLATGRADAEDGWGFTRDGFGAWFQSWAAMRQEACEATRKRGVQSDEMLDRRMACLDRRMSEARALVALLARADPEDVGKAAQAVQALSPIRDCADLELLRTASVRPSPVDRPQVEQTMASLDRARALFGTGRYKEGLATASSALETAGGTGYRPAMAEAGLLVGRLQEHLGDIKAAEPTLFKALSDAEASGRDDLVALALSDLVRVLGLRQARFVEAHAWADLAEAVIARVGEREVLRAELLRSLGQTLRAEQQVPAAVEHLRRSLALWQKIDPDGLETAEALQILAITLRLDGKLQEALAAFQGALALREKKVGPDSDLAATSRNGIGLILLALGRFDEALMVFRQSLATMERTLGPKHLHVANGLNNIGVVFYEQGRFGEALPYFERALAIREAAVGSDSPKLADSCVDVAQVLLELGETDRARTRLEQARAILEKLPTDHPSRAGFWLGLGRLRMEERAPEKALEPLEQSLKACEGKNGFAIDTVRAPAQFLLAKALWLANRDRRLALELATLARETYGRAGRERFRRSLLEVGNWLSIHALEAKSQAVRKQR